jgi:hypothetical protein
MFSKRNHFPIWRSAFLIAGRFSSTTLKRKRKGKGKGVRLLFSASSGARAGSPPGPRRRLYAPATSVHQKVCHVARTFARRSVRLPSGVRSRSLANDTAGDRAGGVPSGTLGGAQRMLLLLTLYMDHLAIRKKKGSGRLPPFSSWPVSVLQSFSEGHVDIRLKTSQKNNDDLTRLVLVLASNRVMIFGKLGSGIECGGAYWRGGLRAEVGVDLQGGPSPQPYPLSTGAREPRGKGLPFRDEGAKRCAGPLPSWPRAWSAKNRLGPPDRDCSGKWLEQRLGLVWRGGFRGASGLVDFTCGKRGALGLRSANRSSRPVHLLGALLLAC